MFESEKKVINSILDYADKVQRSNLNDYVVESKDERDIVTNIDKRIEKYCIGLIKMHFPNDKIVSEEFFSEEFLPNAGRFWVLDPLDGTWNYANGIPTFAVQIAFAIDGDIILSAINIPFGLSGREIYFAEKDNGAYLNGKKIYADSSKNFKQAIVAVSDFSWENSSTTQEINILNSLVPKVGRIRIFGSSAISFAYLASGRINAYLGFDQKVWDIIPGLLLAQEACCIVQDFHSSPYIIGNKNFIATPKNFPSIL